MRDPYALLGVPRDATDDQVKQAFRKLALEWHPDRNKSPEAEERFKEINAAYEAIKNGTAKSQAQGPHFHFDMRNFHTFEDFVRGFHQPRQRRNNDLNVGFSMNLEDALTGKTATFSVRSPSGTKSVTAQIPKGVDDGMKLRVAGGGDRSIPSQPPGDLIVHIRIQPHPTFTRLAQNLVIEKQIDALDAMIGTTVRVPTIDGGEIDLAVPAGVQPGQRLRVAGKGMPIMNATDLRGDMIVIIQIEIPTNLSDEMRATIERAREIQRT